MNYEKKIACNEIHKEGEKPQLHYHDLEELILKRMMKETKRIYRNELEKEYEERKRMMKLVRDRLLQ